MVRYLKSITNGIVGAVFTKLWASSYGAGGVRIMGKVVSLPLAAFGLFTLTSVFSELMHDYVVPQISDL